MKAQKHHSLPLGTQETAATRRAGLWRVSFLTCLAMLAFAGNSILCRLALKSGHIDPLGFTAIRLVSGACVLVLAVYLTGSGRASSEVGAFTQRRVQGSWPGALTLFAYATAFSLAYTRMDAGPGALILFAAVQLSMLLYGRWRGERMGLLGMSGLALSLLGMAWLLLPGSSAPPLASALLMAVAGIAWGAYTLIGKGASSPAAATAGNFLRASPLTVLAVLLFAATPLRDGAGVMYAVLSGALTSALGYIVWYGVVRELSVTRASAVQLSVPVISVLAGTWWLQEPLTLRLILSCLAVLGGMAIVLRARLH